MARAIFGAQVKNNKPTACKEIALSKSGNYFVINDSDLEHIEVDNLKVMRNFLNHNSDFGAVSVVRFKMYTGNVLVYDLKKENHICSGVIMFTRKGLESVDFGIYNNRPTCFSIGKSLSVNGLKYGYTDSKYRVKQLLRS